MMWPGDFKTITILEGNGHVGNGDSFAFGNAKHFGPLAMLFFIVPECLFGEARFPSHFYLDFIFMVKANRKKPNMGNCCCKTERNEVQATAPIPSPEWMILCENLQKEEEESSECIVCFKDNVPTQTPCCREIMCGYCAATCVEKYSACPKCKHGWKM